MNPALDGKERRDLFLRHLDPDSDEAARKYETLRSKLIYYFQHKSCRNPDELADEVVTRVLQRLESDMELTATLSGFCFGVAQNLAKEHFKKARPASEFDENVHHLDSTAPSLEDLLTARQCLDELDPDERAFILRFYRDGTESAARTLAISINAARLRAHRIIRKLRLFVNAQGNKRKKT